MFLNQDSSFQLKVQLTDVVAESQLEISVTYKDNTGRYYDDVRVSSSDTTAVTLLTAPPENTVNIIELIKIYNPDTQANVVEILTDSSVVYSCTVGAKESVILSEEGVSNGLGFNPLAPDGDGSKLTGLNQSQISGLTTTDSPTFAGVTIGSSSGILKRTSGVVSNAVAGTDYVAPDSTGGWVYNNLNLLSNGIWSAATNYSYGLSSLLTDGTCDYEVIFDMNGYASGAVMTTYLTFGDGSNDEVCMMHASTSGCGGSCATLPIKSANRSVTVKNYGGQVTSAYLTARAYRKIKV